MVLIGDNEATAALVNADSIKNTGRCVVSRITYSSESIVKQVSLLLAEKQYRLALTLQVGMVPEIQIRCMAGTLQFAAANVVASYIA